MRRPAVLIGVVGLLQGHAIWHLLTAASVGAFYLYFGGEETPRPVGSE